jgi:hypothetical protein
MVLSRPVLGEPRMPQATPATSGGTNRGIMLAPAMKPLNGVLVRTTIQEKASPITTARTVPPPHAARALKKARWTFSLASTSRKCLADGRKEPNPSTIGLESLSAPNTSINSG